jgi:hypothetical protein
VDSKGVGRELKAVVFPFLRAAGFSEFTSRTAWRLRDNCTDVIDFRSLGSYLGDAIGVTSHSVVAAAGVYFKVVHQVPWATEPMPARPQEPACHARLFLRKSILQLWCWRPDVWYVSRTGSNLGRVVANLVKAVETQALPWLEEFGDLRRALDVFESRSETEMRRGIMRELYGGTLNSFARAEVSSALALALGDAGRAKEAYARMLANPYYTSVVELRQTAEERISLIETPTPLKRDDA